MNIQINVYGAPWSSNAAVDAQHFIEQAMASNHIVKRVFFFFDGVYHGLSSQSPASDENNLLQRWSTIAKTDVDLFICIAAAANRGVLNDVEAQRYDKPNSSAAPFFEVTGLGQWATGFHDCDRIITFK